jgi:hypothetical protein
MVLALSSCSVQEEKEATPGKPAPATKAEVKAPAEKGEVKAPAEKAEVKAEKAPEKAKATKLSGDIGLLDLEKNYMILVTKEGKLITLDFDPKMKATQITPTPSKIEEIGLGSSAVVQYQEQGGKSVATSVEYKPAKAGD